MEKYMQQYLQVMQSVIKGEKPPKLDNFDKFDVFKIQELLLDFNNLVRYENNSILKDNSIMKKAVLEDMFFKATYLEGSLDYNNLIKSSYQIRKLQEGESYSVYNTSLNESSSAEFRDVYVRETGCIKKYLKVMPYNNMQPKFIALSQLNDLIRTYRPVKEDGNYFLRDNNNNEVSCIPLSNKIMLLGYDIRRNPFKEHHFRVFDENGEITNLKRFNFGDVLRSIRNAEAHYSVYNYANGYGYGGKVVKLGNGKVVLYSNRWHEAMLHMSTSNYDKQEKNFYYVCVPHTQKSARDEQSLLQKIDSTRLVYLTTSKPYSKEYIDTLVDKVLTNFENMQGSTIPLKDYLETHVLSVVPDARLQVKELGNKEIIKSRLLNEPSIYNIHHKEKDNAFEQEDFIKIMLYQLYGKELGSKHSLTDGGKFNPISVDLKTCSSYINADLGYFHNMVGLKQPVGNYPHTKVEKQIAIVALCIYKHLIRNHFLDDALKVTKQLPYGVVLGGKEAELQRKIKNLDMSMFEMVHVSRTKRKDIKDIETLNQKVAVLRALRNAVSHNAFKIKFSKNCNLEESSFLFPAHEDINVDVRVNAKALFEFINSPVFADYTNLENIDYNLNVKNVKELKEFIYGLCKSKTNEVEDEDVR